MALRDKFRLTVPKFDPEEDEDHAENLRAIERWANGPLDDRLRGYDGGNPVITYATGGSQITYNHTFVKVPHPTVTLEKPAGAPHTCYISTPTVTGFKVLIYDGAGAQVAAGGAYRVYWTAISAQV